MSDFVCPEGARLIPLYGKVDGVVSVVRYAIVDEADHDYLAQFRWNIQSGYAATRAKALSERYRQTYMHRLLLQPPPRVHVDHINRDKFDNRRSNIRIVETGVNIQNVSRRKVQKSGYRGVSINQNGRTFTARISFKGKSIYLGCFSDPIEAARKYNEYALKLYGEHADLNKV